MSIPPVAGVRTLRCKLRRTGVANGQTTLEHPRLPLTEAGLRRAGTANRGPSFGGWILGAQSVCR